MCANRDGRWWCGEQGKCCYECFEKVLVLVVKGLVKVIVAGFMRLLESPEKTSYTVSHS